MNSTALATLNNMARQLLTSQPTNPIDKGAVESGSRHGGAKVSPPRPAQPSRVTIWPWWFGPWKVSLWSSRDPPSL